MSLEPRHPLGVYEVLSAIGADGMGVGSSMGEHEKALAWMATGLDERDALCVYLKVRPPVTRCAATPGSRK